MSETCAITGCIHPTFKVGLCESHFTAIAKEAMQEANVGRGKPSPPFWRSALYVFGRLTDGLIDGYRKIFQLKAEDLLSMRLDEAETHIRNGSLTQAAAALESAVTLSPNDPAIHLQLAIIDTGAGSFAKALASLRRVQELKPDHEELDARLGEVLVGLGQHDEAIAHLERAVEKSPDSAECLYRLGAALEAAGRSQESVHAFERAAALNDHEPRYHQSLGFAYEALGDHKAALHCFKRAIELER